MLAAQAARPAALAIAANLTLGVLMPIIMAPASKSSPLLVGIAASLSLLAAASSGLMRVEALAALRRPAAVLAAALAAYMALSLAWAHAPRSSADQLGQFLVVAGLGVVLCAAFPLVARADRWMWWLAAASFAAVLVMADLKGGLVLRRLVGSDAFSYRYNRTVVTLLLLLWPLLAMLAARGKLSRSWPLLAIPAACFVGESQTAALGVVIGSAVLPVAWFAPRFVRLAGLVVTLGVLASAPLHGTIARQTLGSTFHHTFEAAHSGDRVDIWWSFEAAARQHLIFGNGFGSSLNLQKAPVAAEVPSDRVKLLGASHPHNAFLQVWVELGAVGAVLVGGLLVLLFGWIGRADPRIQPFLLAWFAVTAGIALVSHGAWQPWWWAAIAASSAAFLAVARELAAGKPVSGAL